MAEPRDRESKKDLLRGGRREEPEEEEKTPRSRPWAAGLVVGGLLLLFFWASSLRAPPLSMRYDEFKGAVRANRVEEVWIGPDFLRGRLRRDNAENTQALRGVPPLRSPNAADFQVARVPEDRDLIPVLEAAHVRYAGEPDRTSLWMGLVGSLTPLFLMFLFYRLLTRRVQSQQSSVLAFGKSKGRVAGDDEVLVRFEDVAGVDEAKEELKEIVDFLKTPEKFTRIGAKIPKGVLLVGPPGTGKTLLAKAVAGEAAVPFFNISGSEFVEMFVGVGAARVRDLFEQAQQHAPCIVFIDELDALGRSRGSNAMGSNEEREQTLNQLLVEMDGFAANKGVIIMAATNRPEILDPALLRPGRFDRQVLVDRPDRKGRELILKVHAREVKLDPDVDLGVIASRTPGFAGADLANIINEAALLAARRDRSTVSMAEVSEAIDRVVAGLEKKSRIITPQERLRVAYHEAGHAIVGEVLPGAEKVAKISIVPRGLAALGYTMHLPTEDRYIITEVELRARLAATLGGRAAEKIAFGDLSTGAANDLAKATELARAMVIEYGMSEKVGPLSLTGRSKSAFLPGDVLPGPREFGERVGDVVDEEVKRIVEEAEKSALGLLTERKETLELLAKELLAKEYLDGDALRALLASVSASEAARASAPAAAEVPS